MTKPNIDLLNKDAFTTDAPQEWFKWLRANEPVYWHPEDDGPGFWVLSKHADIVAVNRDFRVFSSDDDHGGPTGLTVAERQRMIDASKGAKSLPHMDPPDHTKHRKVLEKRFRSRPILALEQRVRQLTGELLDRTIAQGGECDFVHDVAAVVPVIIISELMGLPEADQGRLTEMASANFGADDPEVIKDQEAYRAARSGMQAYAYDLTAKRRAEPRDDVATCLVLGEIDGKGLPDQHIALFIELLVAAGHETALTAISQGMNAFIDNPDQYQLLVDDPSLSISATEEILRWASPIMYFRRAVLQDTEFHGHTFTAGDSVTMWYISGNRDEDVFADPYMFDIRRSPNNHLAFGGGGIHFCLGARLARLEIRVFFEELVKRVPAVERLGPPVPLRSNLFNAFKRLPLRLDPSGLKCPI